MIYQDDRIDSREACAVIGGNRPVHPSRLWRYVKAERISPPVKIGNTVRFSRAQLLADLLALASREAA